MVRSEDIHDYYQDGAFVRVWSIDDSGQARCEVNAIPVADQTQADIDAQVAANAAVKADIEAVEAYEAAAVLAAQDEPPATVSVASEGEETVQVPNPAHAEWTQAVAQSEQPEPQPATFDSYEWTQDADGNPVRGDLISSTPNPLHVAWQAAVDLAAQPEPPLTIDQTQTVTVHTDEPNPDHTAWIAAGETVAGVSADVLTLAQKRAGTWVDPEAEEVV